MSVTNLPHLYQASLWDRLVHLGKPARRIVVSQHLLYNSMWVYCIEKHAVDQFIRVNFEWSSDHHPIKIKYSGFFVNVLATRERRKKN